LLGLSPLETLRRILVEEIAAQDYRAFYWRNHARMDGVIERDKDQKPWNPDQYKAWREQWTSSYTGRENSGKSAVLMPGMKWVERSFSAKDSELSSARKLSREEVSRAYHVPLPMVGILDHATFSNIKEQHKNLYQDALGPWLVYIEEELERQLLPEVDPATAKDVYFEFNIAEKLKGSFEEQADSIQIVAPTPRRTQSPTRRRSRPSLRSIAPARPSASTRSIQAIAPGPSI
jgi:HK97 family phage portal protein